MTGMPIIHSPAQRVWCTALSYEKTLVEQHPFDTVGHEDHRRAPSTFADHEFRLTKALVREVC